MATSPQTPSTRNIVNRTAISFRIPNAYIKHRKANIKHFLAEGCMHVARERDRIKTSYFGIVGRNMMIIVIAAT
jgi:hypothetical protein